MSEHAFVTGATGFIGRWLVPELTRRGDTVTALVRGATLFFHLGAAMTMGLDPEVATQVNERGSERVMALAASAPALLRAVVVSGYRVAQVTAASTERLGAYERSKVHADRRIRALAAEHTIPLTIVNPAVVIGDSRSGETTLFWGFADLVRELYFGRLPAIPGGPRHWMPLVTVDHLARFLAAVPRQDHGALAEYFLLDDRTPDLATLVQRIAARLGVKAPQLRVPMPIAKIFARVRGEADQAEALSFIAEDRYDVGPADLAAERAGIAAPDLEPAIDACIDYLVAARFGATPEARGRFASVAGVPTFLSGDLQSARVLMLHGLPLDGATWDPVVRQLDVPTLRPDLAGLGRSSARAVDRGAWISALTAQLKEPVVLVAHSYGSAFALDAAIRHPDRVRSLVLLAPYFLQARAPAYFRCALWGRIALAAMDQDRLTSAVGDEPYAGLLFEGLKRPGGRSQIARGMARSDGLREELRDQLRRLSIPVTLVHGADEPLLDPVPPGVQIVTLGRGHNPQLEAPAEVAALIGEHLRLRAGQGPGLRAVRVEAVPPSL